jgi:hypothetical protein
VSKKAFNAEALRARKFKDEICWKRFPAGAANWNWLVGQGGKLKILRAL